MIKNNKKLFQIFFAAFILIFLASFQISIVNQFRWGFNVFLVLILFLIFTKHIYAAIFFGWFGGLLIDTAHFSIFGITSITLLSLTTVLMIFQKKMLPITKSDNILIISVVAVLFYHFFEWGINNLFSAGQEKFSFYFLNGAIAIELLFTVVLLIAIISLSGNRLRFNV